MTASDMTAEAALRERIRQDMADTLDEELELELDDHRLEVDVDDAPDSSGRDAVDRKVYFKELFRLQGELVKLQD
jgi:polyphosphate kinase